MKTRVICLIVINLLIFPLSSLANQMIIRNHTPNTYAAIIQASSGATFNNSPESAFLTLEIPPLNTITNEFTIIAPENMYSQFIIAQKLNPSRLSTIYLVTMQTNGKPGGYITYGDTLDWKPHNIHTHTNANHDFIIDIAND